MKFNFKLLVVGMALLFIGGCGYRHYLRLHGPSIKFYPDIHEGVVEDHECLECHHPDREPSVPRPLTRISPGALNAIMMSSQRKWKISARKEEAFGERGFRSKDKGNLVSNRPDFDQGLCKKRNFDVLLRAFNLNDAEIHF